MRILILKMSDEEYENLKETIEMKKAARAAETQRSRIRCEAMISAILLIVLIACLRSCVISVENKGAIEKNVKPVKTVSANATVKKDDDLTELKKQINKYIEGKSGDWSVCVKNLSTGKQLSVNNHQVYAASEIKLYALATAYSQIADGKLKEDDIYNTLFNMTANSDNASFNSIVWSVGKYSINEWCKKNGYKDTVQCHGLNPADNADGLTTVPGGYNLTTVEDVTKIMESIYRGECVSKEYSEKMLDMLFKQKYRDKIPAGIPKDVKVANKTGETDDVSHDAAIVYLNGSTYILSVMVSDPSKAWDHFDEFKGLSELVYKYFSEKK